MKLKKAVVLLSGGLDSTTLLCYAKAKKYKPFCLIFNYGQRHKKEILQAKRIAEIAQCPYYVVQIKMPWQGSALLDKKLALPHHEEINPQEIPATYVPSRNIIFLSFAASYAEVIEAEGIFIGANAIDYSGYPDCRPEFMQAFQTVLQKGLKTGVKGRTIKIFTPLIHKTKAQIIRMGIKLNAPYHLTWSCYKGAKKPCGVCDSCLLRAKGFKKLHLKDPAV